MEKSKTGKLKAPSLLDAMVLVTTRPLGAKLVTDDEHFEEIKEKL